MSSLPQMPLARAISSITSTEPPASVAPAPVALPSNSIATGCTSLICISTHFDRHHPTNVHFPGSRDRVENLLWTIEQRHIVERQSMVAGDIDDLKDKVSFLRLDLSLLVSLC